MSRVDPECFPGNDEDDDFLDWLEENYALDGIREGTDEWDEAKEEFLSKRTEESHYEEYLSDLAEERWIEENPQSVRFGRCLDDLDELLEGLSFSAKNNSWLSTEKRVLNKSFFSYSLAIMEAFLCDTAKALVFHDDEVMYRYLNRYGVEKSFSLLEIYNKPDFAIARVSRQLASVTFHNIVKIDELFSCLFDSNFSFSELKSIVNDRHDLVHRNGFSIDGNEVSCSRDDVLGAINRIKKTVKRVQDRAMDHGLK